MPIAGADSRQGVFRQRPDLLDERFPDRTAGKAPEGSQAIYHYAAFCPLVRGFLRPDTAEDLDEDILLFRGVR